MAVGTSASHRWKVVSRVKSPLMAMTAAPASAERPRSLGSMLGFQKTDDGSSQGALVVANPRPTAHDPI
jgi:hypothetical protein